jgi:hypothetical protein
MTTQSTPSAVRRIIRSRVHSLQRGTANSSPRPSETAIALEAAPRSISASASGIGLRSDGYENDREFRGWLKTAAQRRESLLKAIEGSSLRLITDVPSQTLRDAVGHYLRSRDVQLFHLHHEWMREKGPLRDKSLPERQASFYALWRAREDGAEMPWELDPGRPCDEKFQMRGARKRGEYQMYHEQTPRKIWRTFFVFGIARRTRQEIVDAALMAASREQYRTQFMFADGGRFEAIHEIVAAINADPSVLIGQSSTSPIASTASI